MYVLMDVRIFKKLINFCTIENDNESYHNNVQTFTNIKNSWLYKKIGISPPPPKCGCVESFTHNTYYHCCFGRKIF